MNGVEPPELAVYRGLVEGIAPFVWVLPGYVLIKLIPESIPGYAAVFWFLALGSALAGLLTLRYAQNELDSE